MRALELITGHVIYNSACTYKFQLKTTKVCETGGFSLDGSSTVVDTSDTGITCTTDYIDIPGTYIFFWFICKALERLLGLI